MVTHDPEEAISICDKVAVMNEGEIHQIDTPINLLKNPKMVELMLSKIQKTLSNIKSQSSSTEEAAKVIMQNLS